MSHGYGNPPTGTPLRCPQCGSTNAYCNQRKGYEHRHECEDCGYDGTTFTEQDQQTLRDARRLAFAATRHGGMLWRQQVFDDSIAQLLDLLTGEGQ